MWEAWFFFSWGWFVYCFFLLNILLAIFCIFALAPLLAVKDKYAFISLFSWIPTCCKAIMLGVVQICMEARNTFALCKFQAQQMDNRRVFLPKPVFHVTCRNSKIGSAPCTLSMLLICNNYNMSLLSRKNSYYPLLCRAL